MPMPQLTGDEWIKLVSGAITAAFTIGGLVIKKVASLNARKQSADALIEGSYKDQIKHLTELLADQKSFYVAHIELLREQNRAMQVTIETMKSEYGQP